MLPCKSKGSLFLLPAVIVLLVLSAQSTAAFPPLRIPTAPDEKQLETWWAEHKVSRLNAMPGGTRRTKWTRAVRAIVLLGHIASADAIAVLQAMAKGHPEAQPTRVAREALDRLSAK